MNSSRRTQRAPASVAVRSYGLMTPATAAMRRVRFACVVGVLACSSALAQDDEPYSLKGYILGAAQPECPDKVLTQTRRGSELLCAMGPTTFAGQRATEHIVTIMDGKIAGVLIQLDLRNASIQTVMEALSDKFGQPVRANTRLLDYLWARRGWALSLDGLRATVDMYDYAASKKAAEERKDKAKGDL